MLLLRPSCIIIIIRFLLLVRSPPAAPIENPILWLLFASMSSVLERIERNIDQFIEENDAFQAACDRLFVEADKNDDGRLSLSEVLTKVDAIFLDLDDALNAANIKVDKPSLSKIQDLLKSVDVDNNDTLDEHEFSLFYRQVSASLRKPCRRQQWCRF